MCIMKNPKFSIITVCYNAAANLEQTIQSVLCQDYKNLEYIIIDGKSTDATAIILDKYKADIDHLTSEPDKGIADAMNKGLKCATGGWILFLHAGDYLLSGDTISTVQAYIQKNLGYDIYAFNILFGNSNRWVEKQSKGFQAWINVKTQFQHQSTICCDRIFQKIGNFDTDYQIAMDYDWFLRAYRAGSRAKTINEAISFMRNDGISSQVDKNNLRLRLSEEKSIHYRHCNSWLLRAGYAVWWRLYPFYKLRKYELMAKQKSEKP